VTAALAAANVQRLTAQSAPMEPTTGVRRMKRAPHELMEAVIATDGLSSSPTSAFLAWIPSSSPFASTD
jgi:hypothetical protein